MDLDCTLKDYPDPDASFQMRLDFWTAVASEYPDEVLKRQQTARPDDRYSMALGRLGVTYQPGERVPALAGGFLRKGTPVSDRDQRLAEVFELGKSAGLDEARVASDVARAMIDILAPKDFFKWLEAQESQ